MCDSCVLPVSVPDPACADGVPGVPVPVAGGGDQEEPAQGA